MLSGKDPDVGIAVPRVPHGESRHSPGSGSTSAEGGPGSGEAAGEGNAKRMRKRSSSETLRQ